MEELLEIESFHSGRPLYIFVTDPNFMGSPKMVDRLCDLLRHHELDARFSVLVRVDSIVRNPELTKKMCETGILSYEMGIESPKVEDLTETHKGITLEMQEKAVAILRENGAWAGGTLVIGLPGQTDEEIRRFPGYAKKIGLAGAAFGVATPFPGTEFYRDLEQVGLIVDRDWTKYDERHSVFTLKNVSRESLEQLAVYCHAKFWTLDTLIERARVSIAPGDRMPLDDFVRSILGALRFAWNTTSDYEAENLLTHMKIAAEAGADPCVEEYTRRIGVHNVIEFPRLLLKVLGSQIIQCTIRNEGNPVTSYIVKTTQNTVEYIAALPGRQEDATVNLDINLEDLDLSKGNNRPMEVLGNCIRATISLQGIDEIWSRLRLLAAIGLGATYQIMHQKSHDFGRTSK
jgi:hypothetical protein